MVTKPTSTTRRYASIPETAAYLAVGINTVRRMVAAGEITAYRVRQRAVRIDLNEVDDQLRVVTHGGAA